MKFVRNFNQLNKKDVKIAGGKGAALGEIDIMELLLKY